MNVILLSGGIGNQMFQYAFAISSFKSASNVIVSDYIVKREKQHDGLMLTSIFEVKVQSSTILNLFICFVRKVHILKNKKHWKITCSFIERVYSVLSINLYVEKTNLPYKVVDFYVKSKLNILWGYWQSFKYFNHNAEAIKNIFVFNIDKLSAKSQSFLLEVNSKESVSIHIRRGDFLNEDNKVIFGDICTLDYYQKAIRFLTSYVSNPCFCIFSDDIIWVKNNFYLPNMIFIDWNTGIDSWQDMCLMSKCKHNIIANSTFSWWGAWLNNNPQKIVISPKRFTNINVNEDLIPDDWIKI